MAFRIAMLGAPVIAMAVIVLLLNWLDAAPALAAVSLAMVAVAGGSLFGVFADRLPVFSKRRDGRLTPPYVDRA